MDHLKLTKLLVKISKEKTQLKQTPSYKTWLYQSSETELQTLPSTIFWRIDKSLEMVSKKKCKNFWPVGVCGLKHAKFKMLKFHQDPFSQIFKLNSERRVDKKQKKFLLTLKTSWDKKLLLETMNSQRFKLRVRLRLPSLQQNKDLLFKNKKQHFTNRDLRLRERKQRLRTLSILEKRKWR